MTTQRAVECGGARPARLRPQPDMRVPVADVGHAVATPLRTARNLISLNREKVVAVGEVPPSQSRFAMEWSLSPQAAAVISPSWDRNC